MTPGTVVSMFTHASRLDARTRTIRAFAAAGCPVAHVQMQYETPKQARNRMNARAALARAVALAREVNAVGVLLIEDDVTPTSTLADWLAHLEARESRAVTLYCPHFITTRTHPPGLRRWAVGNGRPPESRVVTVQNLPQWWGSQALWFPLAVADRVLTDPRFQAHERGDGPWDVALRKHLVAHGDTLGMTVPNIIQHQHVRNLIAPRKPVHRSLAFLENAPAPT